MGLRQPWKLQKLNSDYKLAPRAMDAVVIKL
jgi:hypothetical protein